MTRGRVPCLLITVYFFGQLVLVANLEFPRRFEVVPNG